MVSRILRLLMLQFFYNEGVKVLIQKCANKYARDYIINSAQIHLHNKLAGVALSAA